MKMNINQIYYSHKSSTCMNKDGKALSVYDSYQEAQNSARYIGKSFIYVAGVENIILNQKSFTAKR